LGTELKFGTLVRPTSGSGTVTIAPGGGRSVGGSNPPVELPGASGYRAQTVAKQAALPYLHAFAFAPLGVDGGVLVVVRSTTPTWATGEAILSSLRLLTRKGVANDGGGGGSKLPFPGA